MVGMPADSTTGKRFHVETLGCPKNAVDSDKVIA
jgi:tRNA A37 methylthiotransferase MiaB